ncbi:AcrR family transcriptional regulator [Rhizobium sp. BK650]|uniref:TetR/AcrR family transcriptional regulator n=1 Tax=Rhizobium sp. BK650 TaxID=2586990 RepID=UPI00161E48A0|nr:TetR/AcrR family transcriptional regulator [Rhizobium sp. BK650]MBB3656643.1 AcrR family transcriptional regulator [Rhizobium sp. BK650]
MAKHPDTTDRPAGEGGRTARKRRAILDAGTIAFLRDGYLGASMDEIAQRADVSKQTIYKQFLSKEALFLEIVSGLTNAGSDAVHDDIPALEPDGDLRAFLEDYANRQLTIVLTPRLMQLRRVVIGEVERFPALGKALYESGPKRAMGAMAAAFERLAARGLLRIDDASVAAMHFNWLIMSQPLNQAMLLGDAGIPEPDALRRHAAQAVGVFLAAFGNRQA